MLERVAKPSCKVQVVLSESGYKRLRRLAFDKGMTQGCYIEWMMGQVGDIGPDAVIWVK